MVAQGGVCQAYARDPNFERLALTHFDALYNFGLHLTRKPTEADDLIQETYLRAFRFSHRFEPGTHLRAWMFQIMRNVFFTFYRLQRREDPVAENGIPDWDNPVFHDAADYGPHTIEMHRDINRTMRSIPRDSRKYLILAEVHGASLEAIARYLKTPIGTVKSRMWRAREKLRGLLDSKSHGAYADGDGTVRRYVNGVDLAQFAVYNPVWIEKGVLTVGIDRELQKELTMRPVMEARARRLSLDSLPVFGMVESVK